MGNKNLFSDFEALSASYCLSLGYIVRYAPSLRTIIFSTIQSISQEMNL